MQLKEFYETLGADYNTVLRRLLRETLIYKYLQLLLKDPSFEALQNAVKSEDFEAVFREAHTIKGMALNLELPALADAASDLTEFLRNRTSPEADISAVKEKSEKIRNEYETIRNLLEKSD